MTKPKNKRPRRRSKQGKKSPIPRLLAALVLLLLAGGVIYHFRGIFPPLINYFTRPRVQYLFIHCTATKAGVEMTAEQIRRFHTSPPPHGRGWFRVGYTDMIHLDGRIERLAPNNEDGRVDPDEITNGARNYNHISRHIVYVGGLDSKGKPADTRTPAQRKALERYVREFLERHPTVHVVGHRAVAQKACPSFDVEEWLRSLSLEAHSGLHTD